MQTGRTDGRKRQAGRLTGGRTLVLLDVTLLPLYLLQDQKKKKKVFFYLRIKSLFKLLTCNANIMPLCTNICPVKSGQIAINDLVKFKY